MKYKQALPRMQTDRQMLKLKEKRTKICSKRDLRESPDLAWARVLFA